ncbi:MAG: hypothetical protein MRY75_13770 [Marivita sp.]|uniref:hypothetical protein n=1 Tax=Marivita sp. TaxID=2003365 RepID=UPI0025C3BF0C|nr:hypothetical protein [Marivita sp.]MCI5111614.1 hypothetical protein [Marivita sp.]
MSDPVTNVEIEDVLSSIRKLVAEEVRSSPVARKPEKPGRLILTAAHRVREDTPPPSEPVLLTQPILPGESPAEERALDDIPRDARLAEFGEVEGAFPDLDAVEQWDSQPDAPSETGHHEAEGWADPADHEAEEHAWADPADQEAAADDCSDHPGDEALSPDQQDESGGDLTDPVTDAARSELNRLIEEEVSAALALTAEDDAEEQQDLSEHRGRNDGSPSDDTLSASEDPDEQSAEEAADEALFWELPEDEPSSEDAYGVDDREASEAEASDPRHSQPDGTEPMPAPPAAAPLLTLEDKVAALGRLVARDNPEFEEERDRPDADDLAAAASEPMVWPEAPFEDAVEEQPVEDASNVVHAADAWPQAQTYHTEVRQEAPTESHAVQTVETDDVGTLDMDEEMLRQMVIDIVRQELQGALGERITRNVRKLVRREIHRMLISQDFD